MSDTRQIVRWSLGQRCRLRETDEQYADPSAAIDAVARANCYAAYLDRHGDAFGVYGDVVVTSYTHAHDPAADDLGPAFPAGGFLISETFKHLGGAAGLTAMCAACPANTWAPRPAGCAGTLDQTPDDPELDEQLERIFSRLGFEAEADDVLLRTQPRWYGLWTQSPLPPHALRLLRHVFLAMREEDDAPPEQPGAYRRADHLPELDRFIRATELAEANGLPLHVSLAPPGHVDLGWYTVFPHCPLCKAEADLPRWRRKQPTTLYRCQVCGTEYPPVETASSERDDFDDGDLRKQMDANSFKAFAASYLVANGKPPDDAGRIVEANEVWEQRRQAEFAAERKKGERHEQYVREVLYAGLHPVYKRDDDDTDADPADGGQALFHSDEFLEVLRRCERLGIEVVTMTHDSAIEHLDRYELRHLHPPFELFAKWKAEGCNELFGGYFRAPDALVDAYLAGKP